MLPGRTVIDCTGLAAAARLGDLRGVKGEMLLLRLARDIALPPGTACSIRACRCMSCRETDGLFMVGATMIESDEGAHISARSMLELLSAAYALHPAFGEAQIVEIGTGVRAAFPDNLPRLRREGGALLRQRPLPARLPAGAGACAARGRGAAQRQPFPGGDG